MITRNYKCLNGHEIIVSYPDYLDSKPILNKSIEDMLKHIEEYYKIYIEIERLESRKKFAYFDIEREPIIKEINNCYKILSEVYGRFSSQVKPYHWEIQFGKLSGKWFVYLEKEQTYDE